MLKFAMMGGSYTLKTGAVRVVGKGDLVDPELLEDAELDRLKAMGAVVDENDYEEPVVPVASVRPGDMPVDQLAEHIKSEKLNVADTIALAQEDVAIAGRVLEAEAMATGGDPRKGVADALQALIDEDGEDGE